MTGWTIKKIAEVAKAIGHEITQDGETFMFAPIGCDPAQIPGLGRKGFYVLTDLSTGLEGLGWRKGR